MAPWIARMAKIRYHKLAALAVFAATAAWVVTGEFSSVGSAADETGATPAPTAQETRAPTLRTVAVVEPPRVEHSRAIRVSGITEADKRATLATRAAGVIEDLPISLGDTVEAGQIILKLQAEGRESAVETARQLLSQRQAEADAAQRLSQQGSIPRLQLDNALSGLAAARSQLEAAEAELDRNIVRAPFDGIVDKLDVELGSSVAQGAQVATILKLDPIRAIGEVSERDRAHLKPGDKAEIRLVSGQELTGEVSFVSRDANSATRTFRVEARMDNPDGAIPAGMTTEITFRAETVPAVILPRSVVTLSSDGDLGVRGVDGENKVVFYPIDLVDDTPRGLVLGGVPSDVRVIVAGQELISEGETVNAVEADEATIRRLVSEATGISF
jgi:membrane fusion protein, multidrug efflux system